MVREIVKDVEFLSKPSSDCSFPSRELFEDLRDTLLSHKGTCLGLAANMIGVRKRALALFIEDSVKVIFNPVIVSSSDTYDTEEGCLSLEGERKTKRFEFIQLLYFDWKVKERQRDIMKLKYSISIGGEGRECLPSSLWKQK